MVLFENSVHNLEKVFKTSLKIHRWIHTRTHWRIGRTRCLKAQWFLARAFSFFAHDPHAEATHPRKGVGLIIVCFSCRYNRLPICLDSVKKLQIRIFSSLVRCKPGHDVHKFSQKVSDSHWLSQHFGVTECDRIDLNHYILPQWPSTALHTLCWCTCAPSQKNGTVGPHHVSGVPLTDWLSESKVPFLLVLFYWSKPLVPLTSCDSYALSTCPGNPCFYTPAACWKQCCSPLQYAYLNKASKTTCYAGKGCK